MQITIMLSCDSLEFQIILLLSQTVLLHNIDICFIVEALMNMSSNDVQCKVVIDRRFIT